MSRYACATIATGWAKNYIEAPNKCFHFILSDTQFRWRWQKVTRTEFKFCANFFRFFGVLFWFFFGYSTPHEFCRPPVNIYIWFLFLLCTKQPEIWLIHFYFIHAAWIVWAADGLTCCKCVMNSTQNKCVDEICNGHFYIYANRTKISRKIFCYDQAVCVLLPINEKTRRINEPID